MESAKPHGISPKCENGITEGVWYHAKRASTEETGISPMANTLRSPYVSELPTANTRVRTRFAHVPRWGTRAKRARRWRFSHQNKRTPIGVLLFWCGNRESNPYGKTTRPSNVRVCQFRHSRRALSIIAEQNALVKGFLEKNQKS